MEDRQIIALFFARAEQAIDALAQKYGSRLVSIGRNLLDNEQDAQECVNDTYLAIWNTIPPTNPESLPAFTYRVGRNQALKRLRSRNTLSRRGNYDLSLDELADCISDHSFQQILDSRALGECLNAFLATQSKESRMIFLRRYWFGDSIKDIAKVFGCSENTLSVRLSRIRAKLKNHLLKEGYFL